jgi:hypothetical protein
MSGISLVSGDEKEAMEVKPVKYVEVIQKNGKIQKLEFDTFTMGWILPITLRDQVTREEIQIKKDEFDELFIIDQFSNGWEEDKEDWGIAVYLIDGREMVGFFHVSEHVVKGISLINGEEKSFLFEDVKKIKFKR